jgi:hypothetical protein
LAHDATRITGMAVMETLILEIQDSNGARLFVADNAIFPSLWLISLC